MITPGNKAAIVICNPNNPTGYLYSREEMEHGKQIIIKHNLYLFSDEQMRPLLAVNTSVPCSWKEQVEDNVTDGYHSKRR